MNTLKSNNEAETEQKKREVSSQQVENMDTAKRNNTKPYAYVHNSTTTTKPGNVIQTISDYIMAGKPGRFLTLTI